MVYGGKRRVVQDAYNAMTDFLPRLLGSVHGQATSAVKQRLRRLCKDATLAVVGVEKALKGNNLSNGFRPLADDLAATLNLPKGNATSTSAFRDAVVGQRILITSKFFKLNERYVPYGWTHTTRRRIVTVMLDLTKPSQKLIDYVYGTPTRTRRTRARADAPETRSALDLSSVRNAIAGSRLDSSVSPNTDRRPHRDCPRSSQHDMRQLFQAGPREPKGGRTVDLPLRRFFRDRHRSHRLLASLLPERRHAPATPRSPRSRPQPVPPPVQAHRQRHRPHPASFTRRQSAGTDTQVAGIGGGRTGRDRAGDEHHRL
jgi:hypothetical protein